MIRGVSRGIAIRRVLRIYKDMDVSMASEKRKRKRIHDEKTVLVEPPILKGNTDQIL